MERATQMLHLRVPLEGSLPSVTPLFQSSAFEAGSPYFYTRKDNPNIAELEQAVALLEDSRHAVATTCGMSAIDLCLRLLRPGDALVVNQFVYGCTFRLFQREAARLGLDLLVRNLSLPSGRAGFPANTKMVFFETPTNPFLETVHIRAVADAARAANPAALVVVDNTWATPLYQHPLAHGADISLHSGTKYLGGHSDVMVGVLLMDRDDLHDEVRATRFYGGAILDPHAAWLVRRSLQTLPLRLAHQSRVTRELTQFLRRSVPQITRVYYPDVDGEQLTNYAGIVFVDLRPDIVSRYPKLLRSLQLFGTGTGMACVTSMVAQPYTGSHASMSAEEKSAMGLGPGTVRLCFGLEEPADLEADLLRGFAALEQD